MEVYTQPYINVYWEIDMFQKLILAVLFALFGNFANAEVQLVHNAARGELLYSTHCIACHNTQVHWREKKLVTDLASLQSEVQRWQGISGLGWNNEDIKDVARHLNIIYYHYPTSD